MARTRERLIPKSRETTDRRAVLKWMDGRTLAEAAQHLPCGAQHLSRWLRHEVELSDAQIVQWVPVVGASEQTFVMGRLKSRAIAKEFGLGSSADESGAAA